MILVSLVSHRFKSMQNNIMLKTLDTLNIWHQKLEKLEYMTRDESHLLRMKEINEFIITDKIIIMDSICRYKHFKTYVQKNNSSYFGS